MDDIKITVNGTDFKSIDDVVEHIRKIMKPKISNDNVDEDKKSEYEKFYNQGIVDATKYNNNSINEVITQIENAIRDKNGYDTMPLRMIIGMLKIIVNENSRTIESLTEETETTEEN